MVHHLKEEYILPNIFVSSIWKGSPFMKLTYTVAIRGHH